MTPVQQQSPAHTLKNMRLMATASELGMHVISVPTAMADHPAFCEILGHRSRMRAWPHRHAVCGGMGVNHWNARCPTLPARRPRETPKLAFSLTTLTTGSVRRVTGSRHGKTMSSAQVGFHWTARRATMSS
jgi:hypothetical protein